nr:activator of 90 kDa heat shock protein ATPase homolog [Ipomoea batatas]
MARYGEGDKRWIVEERPDGTNVHNWHWAETNCLDWSRTFFTNLLTNQTLIDGEANLCIRTKKLDKLEGEAYVNVRKGKIIPGYELNLVLSWEGEAKDADGKLLSKTDGTVQIPYISDENADEDPEIKITVRDEGPVGRRLKEAFIAKGKPFVLEQVRTWVNAMARGGPAKDELESKTVVKKKSTGGSMRMPHLTRRKKQGRRRRGKILMDENRWKGFTQSNARISREVGGEFSIFDGSVSGTNLELQEGKLIVQKWRFGSWPDGIHSTVRLSFDEPEPGVTMIKLIHTDVPEEDRYGNETVVENTERGWRDIIFHKIRAVFGFGI